MKYVFMRSLAIGMAVSLSAASAFAMEDLRSNEMPGAETNLDAIEGDFLDGAFGTEAVSSDAELGDTRGRMLIQVTDVDQENNAFNAGNSSTGNTGAAGITDGAFSNSSFGQAAVVSGNNNNVQMNTTVNVNLF